VTKSHPVRILIAGLIGGFIGNGVLGALFSSPPIQSILYNPELQSQLFIEITPKRNIPVSVAGLVVLSVIHAWLFSLLMPSIPGNTWLKKGLFWGLTIWLMYWLFQEWFIYNTLLGEPLILNALELTLLMAGSVVEGIVIAFFLARKTSGSAVHEHRT
jgi:sensor histidine kinase YesM